MADIADFVTRNFQGPDLAKIDSLRRQNALGQLDLINAQRQNAVMANPTATPEQLTRAGLPQIASGLQAQQQFNDQQKATAAAVLGQRFLAISQSPSQITKQLTAAFLQSPEFQKGAQLIGIDPSQYSVTEQDTPESLKQQAAAHAAMFGAKPDEYTLGKDQVRIRNGQTVAQGPADTDVTWHDTGDQLVPLLKNGQPAPGIAPIQKKTPPGQAYSQESVDQTAGMIASGQIPMLTGFALKTPWGQAVVAKVGQINPDYQGSTYGTHFSAMKDFTSGKSSQTVRSLNVAIAHLGVLDDLSGALQNNDVQAINRLSNWWKTQTGNPAPTNFAGARSIVANEIVKAVTASGGGVTDRQEAQAEVNAANSPEQLTQVVATWKQLLSGQLGGLRQQYEQGTGNTDFNRFLSPEVIQQLEPAQGVGGQQAANNSGPQRLSPEQAAKLPSGSVFIGLDGIQRTRH